jgi:hypothetical protein
MNDGITIIQSITTDWDKQSRGAPGAIKRNAIPEALLIPLEKCPRVPYALLEHVVVFSQWRNFDDPQPTISVEAFEPEETIRRRCARIQKLASGLRVSWNYTPQDAGMPLRPSKKNDLFDLSLNQWGRVLYNGRFSEEGGWWYRKTVLNIGLFENPVASVFIETSPIVVMDKMAKL